MDCIKSTLGNSLAIDIELLTGYPQAKVLIIEVGKLASYLVDSIGAKLGG